MDEEVCNCLCHKPGVYAFHFRPCCEGECPNCGSWIKTGMAEHAAKCALRTPQPWLTVFQNGYAPQLADSELIALRNGLANDDPRLIQGHTTYPPPLLCIQDWPCEKADAIGFTLLGDDREEGDGGEGITVGQVEAHFARLCYGCDRILGEPAVCRVFLRFWDETPKAEAYRNLIAAIDGILEQRNAQAAVDAEDSNCPLCNLPLDGETGFHLTCTKREQMTADLMP